MVERKGERCVGWYGSRFRKPAGAGRSTVQAYWELVDTVASHGDGYEERIGYHTTGCSPLESLSAGAII